MQLKFTGHGIEVTSAMHQLIEEKFQTVLNHFKKQITRAEVILTVQKMSHEIEIILHIPGTEIVAKASADDMYKAIDQAMGKLDKQLIKYKAKHSHH